MSAPACRVGARCIGCALCKPPRVFVGAIAGRRYRFAVPYGSEAHVFAMSRQWLTEEKPEATL